MYERRSRFEELWRKNITSEKGKNRGRVVSTEVRTSAVPNVRPDRRESLTARRRDRCVLFSIHASADLIAINCDAHETSTVLLELPHKEFTSSDIHHLYEAGRPPRSRANKYARVHSTKDPHFTLRQNAGKIENYLTQFYVKF